MAHLKKKPKKTTAAQFELLLTKMEENASVAKGPYVGYDKFHYDQTWEAVTDSLNAIGPPTRTISEWKKVWTDLRGRIRKKLAERNANLDQLFGGDKKELSDCERKVERILNLGNDDSETNDEVTYSFDTQTAIYDDTPTTLFYNDVPTSTKISVKVPFETYSPTIASTSPQPFYTNNTSPTARICTSPAITHSKKRKKPTTNHLLKKQIENQAKMVVLIERLAYATETQAESTHKQAEATTRLATAAETILQKLTKEL